jgi:hypothetical protein
MQRTGIIDYGTWAEGRELLMPYYGPDYGGTVENEEGQNEVEEGEDDEDEDEDAEENQTNQRVLSEEFVHDSSE